MLNALSLTFFALIDQATVQFNKGLHVLTGETGAGKTLLIQAIHLLSGRKVSSDIIRKGEEKAVIEATFDIEKLPLVQKILEEGGIDFDPLDLLTIKREISREYKNRVFINSQVAPLSMLAKLGPHLLELVSQSSSHEIRQEETQRKVLDQFGKIDTTSFSNAYTKKKELEQKIASLKVDNKSEKLERLKWELDEWENLNYQDGEEEELFKEYKAASSCQETQDKLSALNDGLNHPNLLPNLSQLQKLTRTPEIVEHLQSAIVHLQEASFETAKQLESLDTSPEKYQSLEERLSSLNHLKRKYHVESDEILPHISVLKAQIKSLENLSGTLASLEVDLAETIKTLKRCTNALTEKRRGTAKDLEEALKSELRSLNLPGASVIIKINEKEITLSGQDKVSFYLSANPGEAPSLLSTQSSGGEVSRLLLALKILLASSRTLPTLIFDEIDANIGGKTALMIGEKLKELGNHCQILSITHFPQVAKYADHHLQISKSQKDGRVVTQISPLRPKEKEKELIRMLGGESLDLFLK